MWTRPVAFASFVILAAGALGDCSVRLSGRSPATGSEVCLYTNNYPDDTHIQHAADRWNDICDGGEAMPSLNVGGCNGSAIPIEVVYEAGISTNSRRTCGVFLGTTSGGAVTGGTMTIFQFGQYLSGPEAGKLYACDVQASDTIAHELGHVLGLDDATSSACYGHIMGSRMVDDREIAADDCAEVNQLWNTPAEQQGTCNRHCWTTCEGGVCPTQPITTTPLPTITPILIDLDQNGFHLTGLDDAVMFDLDADGRANRISWTSASSGDAFLVLDRNGNGWIDDGRELFGNATPLASGAAAPNGYEALIELDHPAFGGNGDSMLTPADAAWELLQVWTDRDHDGITDAGELENLSMAGITLLDTRYKRSNKTDAHGNLFRFRSKALVGNPAGQIRAAVTYDVYFVESPAAW
jgi:hypothetical protein